MKVVAIVQARMGSTRLPGKMTMPIAGRPVVAHVFERVQKAARIDEVWLATTTSSLDDVLANWANENTIPLFRGSVDDVLDRYYQAALLGAADVVVRITGDCPLADPAVIDTVVGVFTEGGYDYVCNTQPPTFPDGLDVECFSAAALKKAWTQATLLSEREHVTPYLWKHPELFRIKNIINNPDLSAERWTLDTKNDYELIKRLLETIEAQAPGDFSMGTTQRILAAHPDWRLLNADSERNEGYKKSVAHDR